VLDVKVYFTNKQNDWLLRGEIDSVITECPATRKSARRMHG